MNVNAPVVEPAFVDRGAPIPPVVRLSTALETLRSECAEKPLTIDELEKALKGRGFAMLVLLFTMPFCLLPVPGLAGPFGFAVMLIGARIACGQKPWLPKFIRQRSLSPKRVAAVLAGGIRFARLMERFVKPRLRFLYEWPGAQNLVGFGIAASAFLLMLPIPIPFSNIIPAWAVVLLAAGMMEKDGLLVLLGHLTTVFSWAFVIVAWNYGAAGFHKLMDYF